jgi:hypothetical protein
MSAKEGSCETDLIHEDETRTKYVLGITFDALAAEELSGYNCGGMEWGL